MDIGQTRLHGCSSRPYVSWHLTRWTDGYVLRFLVANKFDHDKTAACIVAHTTWRKDWLPVKYTQRTDEVLVNLIVNL
jgi:hypothetical protein